MVGADVGELLIALHVGDASASQVWKHTPSGMHLAENTPRITSWLRIAAHSWKLPLVRRCKDGSGVEGPFTRLND
jgi:hypothetical protein